MNKGTRNLGLLGGGLLALTGGLVYRDYHAWLGLGEGGLPPTFDGWLQTTRLRLKMRDPFDVTELRAMQNRNGDVATLTGLPPRALPRPKVDPYPVPHRQMDQRPEQAQRMTLQAIFDAAVERNGSRVRYALSHFEKHIQAITCVSDDHVDPVGGTSHGEIGHIHDVDGSMHLVLSPSDAIVAIEEGWGQLHGLAGRDHGLPVTYIMIYGPLGDEDFKVASRLVDASVTYMCGPAR